MIANQVQGDEEGEECAVEPDSDGMVATRWAGRAVDATPLRLGSELASLAAPPASGGEIVLAKSLPD